MLANEPGKATVIAGARQGEVGVGRVARQIHRRS
jgi:hypothetical protein